MPNPHSSNVSQATHQELQTTGNKKKKNTKLHEKPTLLKGVSSSNGSKKSQQEKEDELMNLNNMVSKINFFPFFSSSIFDIEYTNQISSPATKQAIEELKQNSREHSQLRKRIGQSKQNLSNLKFWGGGMIKLHNVKDGLKQKRGEKKNLIWSTAKPGIINGAAMPEEFGELGFDIGSVSVGFHFNVISGDHCLHHFICCCGGHNGCEAVDSVRMKKGF